MAAARRILGVLLILIGLIALVTPLTPGAWLAIIGVELLGWKIVIPASVHRNMRRVSPSGYHRAAVRLRRRFPNAFRHYQASDDGEGPARPSRSDKPRRPAGNEEGEPAAGADA